MHDPRANRSLSFWNRCVVYNIKLKIIRERAIAKAADKLKSLLSRRRVNKCIQQLLDEPEVMVNRMSSSKKARYHRRDDRRSNRSESSDSEHRRQKKSRPSSSDRRRDKKKSSSRQRDSSREPRRHSTPEVASLKKKKQTRSRSTSQNSLKPSEKRPKNRSPSSPRTTCSVTSTPTSTSTSEPASPVLFSKGRRKSRVPELDEDKTSTSSRTSGSSQSHEDARKVRESMEEKLRRVKRKEKVENSRKYYRPKHKFDMKEYRKQLSPRRRALKLKSSSAISDNIAKAAVEDDSDDNIVMSRMESIRSGTRRLEFEKNLDDLVSSVEKDGKNKFMGPESLDQILSGNPTLHDLFLVKSKIENHLERCSSPTLSMPPLDTTTSCHKPPTDKASHETSNSVESSENNLSHSTQALTVNEHIQKYLAKNDIDVSAIKEVLQTCKEANHPTQPQSSINTADNEVSSTTDHIEPCKPPKGTEIFAGLTPQHLEYIRQIPKDFDSIEELVQKSCKLRSYTDATKTSKSEQSTEKPTVPVSNVTSCVISPVKVEEPIKELKTVGKFVEEMPKKTNETPLLKTILDAKPCNIKKTDVDTCEIVKILSKPVVKAQNPPMSTEKPLVKIPNSLIAPFTIKSTAAPQLKPPNTQVFTPTTTVSIFNALPQQNTHYIVQNSTISSVHTSYTVPMVQYPMAQIYASNAQAVSSNFNLHSGSSTGNHYNVIYAPISYPSNAAAPTNTKGQPPSYSQFVADQRVNHSSAMPTTKATLVCPPYNVTSVPAGQGAAHVHPQIAPARPAGATVPVYGASEPATADSSTKGVAALPSSTTASSRCPPTKPTPGRAPAQAVASRLSSKTTLKRPSTTPAKAGALTRAAPTGVSKGTASKSASAAAWTQAAANCSSNSATAFEINTLEINQRETLKKILRYIHMYNARQQSWMKKFNQAVDSEKKQTVEADANKDLNGCVRYIVNSIETFYRQCNAEFATRVDTEWVVQRIVAFDAKANPNTSRVTVTQIHTFINMDKSIRRKAAAQRSHQRMDPQCTGYQAIPRPATQGVYPVESPRGYPGYANQPSAAVQYPIQGVQGFNAPARVSVPVPAPVQMSIRASSAVSVSLAEPAQIPPLMPIAPIDPRTTYKIYIDRRERRVLAPDNSVSMTSEELKAFQIQSWQYRELTHWISKEMSKILEAGAAQPPKEVQPHQRSAGNAAVANAPVSTMETTPTLPQTKEKSATASQEPQSVASRAPDPPANTNPSPTPSPADLATALKQLQQFNARQKPNIEKTVITLEDLTEEVLDTTVKTPSLKIVSQNEPVASIKPRSHLKPTKECAAVEISTVPAAKKVPETANNAERPRPDEKSNSKPRNIIEIDLSDDETVVKLEAPENSEYMVDLTAENETKDTANPPTDSQALITIDDDDDRHSAATLILGEDQDQNDDLDDIIASLPTTEEELECTNLAKEMGIKEEYVEDFSKIYCPTIVGVKSIELNAFELSESGNTNDLAMRMCDNCNIKKIKVPCVCNQVGYCSQECLLAYWSKHASTCIKTDGLGIKMESLDDAYLSIQSYM